MANKYNFFGHNTRDEVKERQAQRVKQSQKLLKELYHEELNPKYAAPIVRGIKTIIVLSIVTIILLSSVVTIKYNNFIFLQEEVYAKKGMLESAIQRRMNLFGNLAQLTMNHAVLEDEVFTHVADVRKQLVDKLNFSEAQKQQIIASANTPLTDTGATTGTPVNPLKGIMGAMTATGQSPVGQLLAVAEQYPDIKSAETYKQMMTHIVEIEDRIANTRVELLTKIQFFNIEIARFPWYYLAKLTNFKRMDYFEAEAAGHNRPVMSGKDFEALMPFSKAVK